MKNLEQTKDIAERMFKALQNDLKYVGEDCSQGALARGRVLHHAGYKTDAAEQFELAIQLDEKNYDAWARLILTSIGQNQPEKALDRAVQLAAKAPDYAMQETTSDEVVSSFTLLGNALVLAGRNKDAIEAYTSASKKCPKDTTSAARLAQLHLAAGNPAAAMDQAKVFKDNPRFADLSSILGLGAASTALLPEFNGRELADRIALDVHGRPLTIDGEARLAELSDDSAWCADIPELSI
ncbi:MAG: hypothetical protein WA790_19915 [Sulfitobacter sp.]